MMTKATWRRGSKLRVQEREMKKTMIASKDWWLIQVHNDLLWPQGDWTCCKAL
jgi:hypothetical protein